MTQINRTAHRFCWIICLNVHPTATPCGWWCVVHTSHSNTMWVVCCPHIPQQHHVGGGVLSTHPTATPCGWWCVHTSHSNTMWVVVCCPHIPTATPCGWWCVVHTSHSNTMWVVCCLHIPQQHRVGGGVLSTCSTATPCGWWCVVHMFHSNTMWVVVCCPHIPQQHHVGGVLSTHSTATPCGWCVVHTFPQQHHVGGVLSTHSHSNTMWVVVCCPHIPQQHHVGGVLSIHSHSNTMWVVVCCPHIPTTPCGWCVVHTFHSNTMWVVVCCPHVPQQHHVGGGVLSTHSHSNTMWVVCCPHIPQQHHVGGGVLSTHSTATPCGWWCVVHTFPVYPSLFTQEWCHCHSNTMWVVVLSTRSLFIQVCSPRNGAIATATPCGWWCVVHTSHSNTMWVVVCCPHAPCLSKFVHPGMVPLPQQHHVGGGVLSTYSLFIPVCSPRNGAICHRHLPNLRKQQALLICTHCFIITNRCCLVCC